MTSDLFTRELVQAVSAGSAAAATTKRLSGQRLKAVAATLPQAFRVCTDTCFRQEAHGTNRIWQSLANNHLPETIASWTIDIGVAKTLKGGVRPTGLQGVIFKITPPKNSVVL